MQWPQHPELHVNVMIYGEMIHDLHRDHKIKLTSDERPYICDGCHEIGVGRRYSCPFPSCNFHLHKCCALPEPTLTHPFFPDYVFVFLQSDKETGEPCSRHCNACAKSIKGFVYHCFDEDCDLHPSCATLPDLEIADCGGKKLVLKLKRKSSSKCDQCNKKEVIKNWKTWAYVSDDEDCHLHIGCVKDLLCEAWEDRFLKGDEPDLRIVLDKGKKQRGGRFKKYKGILKFALRVIIAVIAGGDPTTLVASLISSILH